MQEVAISAPRIQRLGVWRDLAVAVGLALVLSIAWGAADWARLSRLILPDPDDMMRLAQVRDWLAGQATNDWRQHRMGLPPAGAAMHWSRVNDLGPAAIILALTPLAGRHAAELAAVLLYPAALFALHLFLAARIGGRMWGRGAGPIAAVLAGLAYPGTTIFVPGRIDHHALQAVLIAGAVLAAMRRPSLVSGATAGLAVAVSLVVGLETALQLAALTGTLALAWAMRGDPERRRLAGFAFGLTGGTLPFLLSLRPTYWSPALCDAFTPASSTATLLVAGALGALAGGTPWLATSRTRLIAGMLLAGLIAAVVASAYPGCLAGPYAATDPFLRRMLIGEIGEAKGLFAQPSAGLAIAYGGLTLTAAAVSGLMLWTRPLRRRALLPLAAVILASAAVTLFQVRGAYFGAALAGPMLAGLVLAARRSGRTLAVLAAWLAATGAVYGQAPALAASLVPANRAPTPRCDDPRVWAELDRYPSGLVMAPTDSAAYLIGATRHATPGGNYHRNGPGNLLLYRFFLSSPESAAAIARRVEARYLLFCPGDFAELDVLHRDPASIAATLARGRTPPGHERLPLSGTGQRFYRLRP